LHQTSMPSVLIETGFLTNKEEEKFLTSNIGQDYISSAVFRAFKEYKNELESKKKIDVLKKEEENNPKEVIINDDKSETQVGKKNKKRNKKNNLVEQGVVFKVQITSSPKKIELKPGNFNGIEGVGLYEAGGLYRYVVGVEKNMTDANRLQLQMRAKGFKDAFIVAFSDGERISISKAINLQDQ
jgi:N-acetylmuramoyl-L-alanine amidase